MKILTKDGHLSVTGYLVDYCKYISLEIKKAGPPNISEDKLNLISSESLLVKVESCNNWKRSAESVIKPLKFNLNDANDKLSSMAVICDTGGKIDKNLSDFKSSLIIYEALKDLPAAASVDWTLWSGLAFGPCSEYMKQRWNVPPPVLFQVGQQTNQDEDNSENEAEGKPQRKIDPINRARGILLQRWIGRGAGTTALTRHGIARLWWIARVADMASKEPEARGKSMEHYLRILYADQNIQWSIVLRRYGAMSRLVSVLLDKIYNDYLESDSSDEIPYKLKQGSTINDVKQFTKLLNTSAGGSLYDLKDYQEITDDVNYFDQLAKQA